MTRDLKSGLFFLALSLLTIWESLRAGFGTLKEPGSGMVSLLGGAALCALSISLIREGWGVREVQKPHPRRVILAIISLFVYSLLLETLGFLVATFLLVGVLFHLGEHRRWWVLVGISALVSLLAYGIFGGLLHVYFPKGLLGPG